VKLRYAWLTAVMVGITVAATTGCGGSEPESPAMPTLPDGAIMLTQNQPNRFEGLVVVASAIDASGADISGSDGTSVAEGHWVDVDGTVEIQDRTLRLVATWVDPDPGEGDGADMSKAWVVVEE